MSSVWEQAGLLASGLMVRWSMQGHNFGATQATRIATLLIANATSNGMDIDYIQWAAEKSVARYRKTGTYSRQNARLSKSQKVAARTLTATLLPKLMQIARDPSFSGKFKN